MSQINMDPNAIKLGGTSKEKSAAMQQALDEEIIGQRVTKIELTKFDAPPDKDRIATQIVQLVVQFDNGKAYIARIEGIIKVHGEALANVEEDDAR